MPDEYTDSIFVNCPFDSEYKPFFNAIVFAIYKCGYLPRCAFEIDDASEARISKIAKIIGECRLGVHDISRTELSTGGLPRFNMPLELGLFFGAKFYGGKVQKTKRCLVFDRDPYRYQQFISDIAGQGVTSHDGEIRTAVTKLRDWLATIRHHLPGGGVVWDEYQVFLTELPEICQASQLIEEDLIFADYVRIVYEWLQIRES